MKELTLYIDGKEISRKNINNIQVTNSLVIIVELIYPDKRERIYTDSTQRKIELRCQNG
jgi:hypothetical protein